MSERPTFVLVLRPLPGVDGERALRAALKFLLRRFGLRVNVSAAPTLIDSVIREGHGREK